MAVVGDEVIGFAASRRRTLLRRFGPEDYRRLIEGFAERPALVRLLAAVGVGSGLWLALRQYSEE